MTEVDVARGYTAEDEGQHRPTDEPWWQESVAFHWFDAAEGIGGMHRIGHEPNDGQGGHIVHQHGVFDAGARFRRLAQSPLSSELDPAWFGDERASFSVASGKPRFRFEDEGVSLELEMTDFYPLADFFPRGSASLDDEFASHHYETSFRVEGRAEIDGRSRAISGFGHRDHSWGVRKWHGSIAVHRWVSGVIDESLAFGSIFWLGPEGPMVGGGYVVVDQEIQIADRADIVVHMEADGLTHRGGVMTLEVAGEPYVFEFEAIDGWVSEHHDVVWVDELCRATHAGRIGYANVEVSNNLRMGTAPVRIASRAAIDEGLVRFAAGEPR